MGVAISFPDGETQALLARVNELSNAIEPSWFGTLPDEVLRAIAFADALDFDPDSEDGADDEPYLGWTGVGACIMGDNTDREIDAQFLMHDHEEPRRRIVEPEEVECDLPPSHFVVPRARDGKPMTAEIIVFRPRMKRDWGVIG